MNVNRELPNALSNVTDINDYLLKVQQYFDYLSENPPVLEVKEKASKLNSEFVPFYEQVRDVLAYAKALADYIQSVDTCLSSIAPSPLDALASLSIASDRD